LFLIRKRLKEQSWFEWLKDAFKGYLMTQDYVKRVYTEEIWILRSDYF
jgi:hypothetical protein